MLHTTPKQSAIWYICEIQFFPLCDFAPLQIFKETTEVASGAKVSQIHYSKTLHRLLKQLLEFYYPMNLHYSKTSKEVSEAATSVCITGH